jgi:transcriptional regulator with XRE-family HTH domain
VRNISYENFANDYDLPRMQFWRIEKGKVNLTVKSLLKILTIHNTSLADFFGSESKRAK